MKRIASSLVPVIAAPAAPVAPVAFAAFVALAALAAARPLRAQNGPASSPGPAAGAVQRAVATITPEDYHRRIAIIADDSMRGRGTPSPELEEVAAWIAGEFRNFGLRPGGDSGTFFQRYRIRLTQLDPTSAVTAAARGTQARWTIGRDVTVGAVGGPLGPGGGTAPVVLVVGTPADTVQPFGGVDVTGRVVIQVGAQPGRGGGGPPLLRRAKEAGVAAWITLTNQSDSVFRLRAARALEPMASLDTGALAAPGMPVFAVRDASAAAVLAAAGENLAALRAQTAPTVRELPALTVAWETRLRADRSASAPNVIGVLEGSDPVLKHEYVFFTGHMDHVGTAGMGNGCTAAGADSICNGADDDASGTTGVVMLAHAFSRLNPRPRRTLVFMTVSGEERGLWGSHWYSEHPEVPLASTVADLNMDMIGRYYDNHPGWRDTIAVIGKEHSSLGAVADQVTREHPDLHMNLVDDLWPAQRFYFRSDHYNFARKGVPILFFFNGTHPDYHRPSDSVDKIDAEKASRIVRMVFYVGLDVANATERPQWNPESRRQIVEAGH